jgi:hypothetical protein
MASTFIGTWETTWEDPKTGSHGGLILTVSESIRTDPSGKVLDGMYDLTGRQPGTMHGGPLSGDVWSGDWMNSATDTGRFTLKLGDKDSFSGTYSFTSRTGEFKWYSTRLKRRHIDA